MIRSYSMQLRVTGKQAKTLSCLLGNLCELYVLQRGLRCADVIAGVS